MAVDKEETGVTVLKSILGVVPYVGTLLDEMLFEHRGRIKQKRIATFVENFGLTLSKFKEEEIDIDEIKSEDFSDFFESLLLQVAKTGSEAKAKRFNQLLIKQITEPLPLDEAEIQLQVIAALQDHHIIILEAMYLANNSGYVEAYGEWVVGEIEIGRVSSQLDSTYWEDEGKPSPVIQGLQARLAELKREYEKNEKKWKELYKPFNPSTYGANCDYSYYVQDLCNKGLLVDRGVEYPGVFPFYCVEITHLGMNIIDRLKGNQFDKAN